MEIKRIVFILFACNILSSCDKPRSIRLYNDLNSKIVIQFINLEDSFNSNKSISLHPGQNMILLINGRNGHVFGNWSKLEIEEYSKSLKYFSIIVNDMDTFYIKDKEEIRTLLWSRRFMLNNSLVKLKIDNDLLLYMHKNVPSLSSQ